MTNTVRITDTEIMMLKEVCEMRPDLQRYNRLSDIVHVILQEWSKDQFFVAHRLGLLKGTHHNAAELMGQAREDLIGAEEKTRVAELADTSKNWMAHDNIHSIKARMAKNSIYKTVH